MPSRLMEGIKLNKKRNHKLTWQSNFTSVVTGNLGKFNYSMLQTRTRKNHKGKLIPITAKIMVLSFNLQKSKNFVIEGLQPLVDYLGPWGGSSTPYYVPKWTTISLTWLKFWSNIFLSPAKCNLMSIPY